MYLLHIGILVKRDVGDAILNTELIQFISQHANDQKGSPYNPSFMTVIPSHCCKEIPIG